MDKKKNNQNKAAKLWYPLLKISYFCRLDELLDNISLEFNLMTTMYVCIMKYLTMLCNVDAFAIVDAKIEN